jgi:acetolactate decarboxylase
MTVMTLLGFFLLPSDQTERPLATAPVGEVRWLGAMRKVMREGDLTGVVDLRALADRSHLYAVGPLEGLRGEVTIWDGKPSLATLKNGKVAIGKEFQGKACFLVFAQVSRWREFDLPANLNKPEALEGHIRQVAHMAGVNTEQPIPFLVCGTAAQATLHIVNKTDNAPHTPKDHDKIKVPFDLEDQEVKVIGFYSEKHAGIFTHHDSNVHVHVLTVDGKLSGHLDRLVPGKKMRLSLPQVEETPRR